MSYLYAKEKYKVTISFIPLKIITLMESKDDIYVST